jgi:hypothetical protein
VAHAHNRSSRLPLARLPRACRGRGCSSEEGQAAIAGLQLQPPNSPTVEESDIDLDRLGVSGWRLFRFIELHGGSPVARYSFTGIAMDKTGHAVLRGNSFSHRVPFKEN